MAAARMDLHASFYGGPGFVLYHAWGKNSAKSYHPHFHGEYLIGSQLRGYEDFEVSGKMERFCAGDVVLINPKQVHTGNVNRNSDLEYVNLYAEPELIQDIAQAMGAANETPEFTLVKSPDRGLAVTAQLLQLLQLFHAHAQSTTALGTRPHSAQDERLELDARVCNLVGLVLERFSNLHQPRLHSSKRVAHRKIARALEFIHEHLAPSQAGWDTQFKSEAYDHADSMIESTSPTRDVNLDELAAIAELSKYHFLRQFAQTVGMTPGAYLRSLRLCEAARRLRVSDRPILDIALSVGFADHPSFSRAFARYMGMTPSTYQRLNTSRVRRPGFIR